MSEAVYLVAARRTPVAPRGGALQGLAAHELAAPVVAALLADAGLDTAAVDGLILGNALYGGGNPARLVGLAAGLAPAVAAMSVDTQCCAGLDAILLAAHRISCGAAGAIIAGGLESYSRSPRRLRRALPGEETDREYQRPPFTPWPDRDPEMLDAAARLAAGIGISRAAQEDFAIDSHAKARQARERLAAECVPLAGVAVDTFTRTLLARLCGRLPVLAGDGDHGLTSATVAVEADAAAAVLVVGESLLPRLDLGGRRPLRLVHGVSRGGDPENPPLAPIAATRALLADTGVAAPQLAVTEVMEAFAVQAMVCIREIGLPAARVNVGGGALARGHPIGASGGINVVRLWQELQALAAPASGVATIAAAGGLGSAVLLRRG